MADKNKTAASAEALKDKEMDLEAMEGVTGGVAREGGSLDRVRFTETTDISADTKNNI